MKRCIALLTVLILCVLLFTGCGCKHEWKDATCDEPMTCQKCGETEGENLDHIWLDANCEEPVTCSLCGKTRGEALGHTWMDATYEAPQTCATCGKTQGEALVPDFEAKNILPTYIEPDVTYEYHTSTYPGNSDTPYQTVGDITVSNYRCFEGDETHPAEAGYLWYAIDLTFRFHDLNARNYGWSTRIVMDNYYDILYWDEGEQELEIPSVSFATSFPVLFNSQEYTCLIYRENDVQYPWVNHEKFYTCTYYVRCPVDYDGVLLSFMDAYEEWPEDRRSSDLYTQNTLTFRFGSKDLAPEYLS